MSFRVSQQGLFSSLDLQLLFTLSALCLWEMLQCEVFTYFSVFLMMFGLLLTAAVFHTVWTFLQQEELSRQISGLIHSFQDTEGRK